ncbi:MAG: YveK family protein [Anaerolineae bacterium]
MDLRQYWAVFRRRVWIVVLLVTATGLSYAIAPPPRTSGYVASMRFVVGVLPEESDGSFYTYDRYYTWLTAEYLVDDLSEVVKSRAFASDVAELSGIAVPTGAIQGATSAGKLHRILSVSVTWHDAQELEAIADAVVETLTQRAGTYLAQLGTEQTLVHAIDPPVVAPLQPSLRERLDLVLRLGLALVVGVIAIFGLHALDRSVRTREEVEALGVPVLAQIPPTRSWWHRAIFRRADR